MHARRNVILVSASALSAATISMIAGVVRAQSLAAQLRAAGFPITRISTTFWREIARWSYLALATAAAVAIIVALDRLGDRRRLRWIHALLVLAAPLTLATVGLAAYVPDGDARLQGFYIHPGELPLLWGLIAGFPLVILFHVIGRIWNRSAP
ncbi:MAG TPA: hypothetical protein VF824_01690 [Thermoanaerobaculia bacterium]